jgi:hypothetical protein
LFFRQFFVAEWSFTSPEGAEFNSHVRERVVE